MKDQNIGGSGRTASPRHLKRAQWRSVRLKSLTPAVSQDVIKPIIVNKEYR